MVRVVFVLLGVVAAVCAQATNENGPLFDPSNAPVFASSGLVFPTLTDNVPTFTQTPTVIRSRVSSAASLSVPGSAQVTSYISSASRSTSNSTMSRHTSSRSAPASLSSTHLSISSRSASAQAQSTGVAARHGQGMVGVIAGGVIAGLAIL
ncbi:hypothetical protein ACN47E_002006 [Coniothyrium glycines]